MMIGVAEVQTAGCEGDPRCGQLKRGPRGFILYSPPPLAASASGGRRDGASQELFAQDASMDMATPQQQPMPKLASALLPCNTKNDQDSEVACSAGLLRRACQHAATFAMLRGHICMGLKATSEGARVVTGGRAAARAGQQTHALLERRVTAAPSKLHADRAQSLLK